MRDFIELTKMVFEKENRAELKRAGRQLLLLIAAQFIGFSVAYQIMLYAIWS